MDGSIISYTIGYLFFSIVFTILSIKVLKDRGYGADKFVFWGLASFIFGIFGFLLCLGMPNLVKKKQQEERQCMSDMERIKRKGRGRFCGF